MWKDEKKENSSFFADVCLFGLHDAYESIGR